MVQILETKAHQSLVAKHRMEIPQMIGKYLVVSLISACLKMLAAWGAWSLAMWLQVPEWAMLCFVIMAVQSTYLKVNRP